MFKYCYFLTLSGFFVTETLFITAAHFNNDTNKPCQDGMPEDEVYQALQTEGNGIAQVNIRRFPTSMSSKVLPFPPFMNTEYVSDHHKENKPVHLVHLDLVRDVAVFELDRGQAPVDAFLGHDALGNADTMEELDKNGTLFTIGYNSDVARDVFAAAATSYLEAILQNPERARYVKDHGPKGVLNTVGRPRESSILLELLAYTSYSSQISIVSLSLDTNQSRLEKFCLVYQLVVLSNASNIHASSCTQSVVGMESREP